MRAFNLIRSEPHYRRDAFDAGLRSVGYDIVDQRQIGIPKPTDLLVIWNRYAHWADLADRFEAAGAAVLIAENGIIGATENEYAKQYDLAGDQLYTLALNYHNGGGRWWIGEPGRWRQQGIEVKPWREDGEHILVLPQRGFGPAAVAPPKNWLHDTLERLKAITIRPIKLRPHPGNYPAKIPLSDDLRDCWCAVTWGSGAGIKALCAGVPVYSEWPQWLGFPGALSFSAIGRADIEPSDDGRQVMLDRLAWCQWTVSEIASGEPFRRLLAIHGKRAVAA